MDDYLILVEVMRERENSFSKQALSLFEGCVRGLSSSLELPVEGRIHFLALVLSEDKGSICWCSEPRASKGVLLFSSVHSKLVKRGIATSCMGRP